MHTGGDDARWRDEVYRPFAPQLTVRAIAVGAAIGAVMCLSNLYLQLKLGVILGVAVTACVLAHTSSRVLARLSRGRIAPLEILESNSAQTLASSAGYATGSTMASAIAAYLLITGHHVRGVWLFAWTLLLSALGVFFAIPFKRRLINVEQLPFPTGTAAAETLRSLHASGGV